MNATEGLLYLLAYIRDELHKYDSAGEPASHVMWGDCFRRPFASGLCYALDVAHDVRLPDQSYAPLVRTLNELQKRWPEYSGSPAYPVPGPSIDEARGLIKDDALADEYESSALAKRAEWWFDYTPGRDFWIKGTTYGDARRRLLDFCINELQRITSASKLGYTSEYETDDSYTGEVMRASKPVAFCGE